MYPARARRWGLELLELEGDNPSISTTQQAGEDIMVGMYLATGPERADTSDNQNACMNGPGHCIACMMCNAAFLGHDKLMVVIC